MKGVAYYDSSKTVGNCNFCGNKIDHEACWVYEEGDIWLNFCQIDCIENFLELNKLQDVEDEK